MSGYTSPSTDHPSWNALEVLLVHVLLSLPASTEQLQQQVEVILPMFYTVGTDRKESDLF